MHKTILRTFFIAVIATLPTLSVAADAPPAVEAKPALPAQTQTVTAPLLTTATENKPVAAAVAVATAKIGYVDIIRIGADSEGGKALKNLLTVKQSQLQGKIDGRKKQVEKFKASIEAQLSTMTQQQKEAKSKEFQKKLDEFQKFARSSEEELMALQEKETRALYDVIEKAAIAHGKAGGFSVIVVKKDLLYLGSSISVQDVTDALIKLMNEAGQKK